MVGVGLRVAALGRPVLSGSVAASGDAIRGASALQRGVRLRYSEVRHGGPGPVPVDVGQRLF